MYFQITTRCNMTCAHCCFSCTAQGKDMSLETFRKGLEQFCDETISIGGGEPTIHPEFWTILIESIAHCDYVWLATNGSMKETSLKLAKLTKKEVISCELSQDDFHDDIDYEVIEAFKDIGKSSFRSNGYTAIRDVSDKVKKNGRAIETGVWCDDTSCGCPGPILKPDGKVYMCGCPDAIEIGNIEEGFYEEYNDHYSQYDCMKDYLKENIKCQN